VAVSSAPLSVVTAEREDFVDAMASALRSVNVVTTDGPAAGWVSP
jgi:hypothetical protein